MCQLCNRKKSNLTRAKECFKALHEMSSDRSRAGRMKKSTSEETSFYERFGTELPGMNELQKMNTCNNSQAPEPWPSRVDKA